jgi:hypothetical protein
MRSGRSRCADPRAEEQRLLRLLDAGENRGILAAMTTMVPTSTLAVAAALVVCGAAGVSAAALLGGASRGGRPRAAGAALRVLASALALGVAGALRVAAPGAFAWVLGAALGLALRRRRAAPGSDGRERASDAGDAGN